MKVVFVFIVLTFLTPCVVQGRIFQENYVSALRDMRNPQVVEFNVLCAVEQGPCDDRGSKLRRYIPLMVLGRPCPDCTRTDLFLLRTVISSMKRRYPKCWSLVDRVIKQQPIPDARGCAH